MRNKQFLTLIIITFFVGMVWLIADIIFNTKASIPISDKLQTLLEPVNPNFNARVLEIIDKETLDQSLVPVSEVAPISSSTDPAFTGSPLNQGTEGSPSGQPNL